jgi:hypothetical protein
MATLEEIAARLDIATQLLSTTVEEIRDLPLEPVSDNLRAIGESLASLFEVRHIISAMRPDLRPVSLEETGLDAEANRRLTALLPEAYRLVQLGKVDDAIAALESYAAAEVSELHKQIALAEAKRIHLSRK